MDRMVIQTEFWQAVLSPFGLIVAALSCGERPFRALRAYQKNGDAPNTDEVSQDFSASL